MPRTTLDLDASVLEQLRRRAHAEHKSMGALASERLAAALREDPAKGPAPLAWPSRRMGAPKIDLADKEALRRLLDGQSDGMQSLGPDSRKP
ncbi:MAG TPA: antitoxin [Thermoanaerobaculia bacterium]|nr:antitoxin [Thermoanaerobaculia bacterium]